jgi:hypothetical protein
MPDPIVVSVPANAVPLVTNVGVAAVLVTNIPATPITAQIVGVGSHGNGPPA